MNDAFSKYDYTLTGMGINPHYNINHNKPIPNERYRMLYHHLHTYKAYEYLVNKNIYFWEKKPYNPMLVSITRLE